MSTNSNNQVSIENALSVIPNQFRSRLVKYYKDLKRAFVSGDFDACGSRSGKFCETFIRFIQNELESTYTPFGNQLNLYNEARRLEGLPKAAGPEAFRVFIPRALCFLYTLRNKRGFAHVGGDVDSDPIDAATCVRVSDWCLCELVRIVHNLSLEDAQALVDSISSKEMPEIWSVAGRKRVLKKGLDYKSQVLLLLYSEVNEAILIEDLFDWTEYSRMNDFRRHVLTPLHKERLIEWDKDTDSAIISPVGIDKVQNEILK